LPLVAFAHCLALGQEELRIWSFLSTQQR